MTGYVIDTDWAIEYLRANPKVTSALQRLASGTLFMSVVSLAELYEGVFGSRDPSAALGALADFLSEVTVLPVGEDVARVFAEQRAKLRRQGLLIDNFDLLIAATCLLHGYRLLTGNTAHFGRVEGLKLGFEGDGGSQGDQC